MIGTADWTLELNDVMGTIMLDLLREKALLFCQIIWLSATPYLLLKDSLIIILSYVF